VLKDGIIRTFEGAEVPYEDFIKEMKLLNSEGLDVYIGTDSQVIKQKISIATCICFYKRGIAKNRVYYIKKRVKEERYPTLRSRMLFEAYTSLEAALEIDPFIKGSLTVHLDIGSDFKKNKTAKFSKELQILVKSQGFGCEIKPNSWASSSLADMYTKS
tara:strand:- start:433 stop:909 length:477 start_codon:yes stop_codon:yes gene_type:complete